jgi:hypothetical protein
MDTLKKIKINSVGKQKENGRKTEGKREITTEELRQIDNFFH